MAQRRPTTPATATAAAPIASGGALAERAGALGARLGTVLRALHLELFPARVGPKRAADVLGQPVPMASRVLAALGEGDPVALLHRLPGPDPLRRWVRALGRKGAGAEGVQAALQALDDFDALIAAEGGDRSALDAQLVAWLPGARRTLELRRRQAVFRGLSELEGVACQLELSTIVLQPARDGVHLDLLCVQARTGLVALRPGLRTKFVTERVTETKSDLARAPRNLDGSDPMQSPGGARLDAYCVAPPAQLEVVRHADRVQYLLATPGHGPNAEADFVIAELNPGEFRLQDSPSTGGPFFSHLVQTPTRAAVLDVVLHPDLVPRGSPEVFLYRNVGELQARPKDPAREVDRIDGAEPALHTEGDVRHTRLAGLPRYGELLGDVFTRLGWSPAGQHLYRVELVYPVPGTQASLVFTGTRF